MADAEPALMVPFSPEPAALATLSSPASAAPSPADRADPADSAKVAVVALFDFPGVEPTDLPFGEGDVFEADAAEWAAQEGEGGWVTGWHRGRDGAFPSNYVKRA